MAYTPPLNSLVSTVNSTSTNLAANATFTGTAEDITQYASITVNVFVDQASAANGLSMQQSIDGTNWDVTDVYSIPALAAGGGKTFGVQTTARWYRLVYINGATATTALRIQSVHHVSSNPESSVRPQDARSNENDMQESLGYEMLYNGTSWDRARNGQQTSVLSQSVVVASDQAAIAQKLGSQVYTINFAATSGNTQVFDLQTLGTQFVSVYLSAVGASISTTFQGSYDGTNWAQVNLYNALGATFGGMSATGVPYTGPVPYRYFRITYTQTSGTTTGFIYFSQVQLGNPYGMLLASQQVVGSVNINTSQNTVSQGTAGTAPWLTRHAAATTASGLLNAKVLTAATTNATSVKTTAAAVYGWSLTNTTTTAKYLRVFNKASAPTMGTDSPVFVIPISGSSSIVMQPNVMNFALATGFAYAITGAAADLDATATAANDVVGTIWYI